jgi:hypothetical protein
MICPFSAVASVHCTTLHNFFRSLQILLNRTEQFLVKHVYTFCKPAYTRALSAYMCTSCVCIYTEDILYFIIRCGTAAAGIFNAWNRAQNTIYNLAQRSPHRVQQHDREQQQKDRQEWRRFLLSDNNDYDREDIIISIDDVSAMSSPSTSSSTLVEGTRSNNNDHNQENLTPMMKQQEEEEKKKDRKVRVVSFRLSERDYERHLSMAKLCYENGLTKGPDIVSYIRLSMECLSRYIISQAEAERSAKKGEHQQQPQKKQEGGVEQQQDVVDYHTMTASPSRVAAAAAATNTAMRERSRESIPKKPAQPPPTPLSNLHEYFQPVFDQVDELNKTLDSLADE